MPQAKSISDNGPLIRFVLLDRRAKLIMAENIAKTLNTRAPNFETVAQDGGNVVNPSHRSLLPHRKCFCYLFLTESKGHTLIRKVLYK